MLKPIPAKPIGAVPIRENMTLTLAVQRAVKAGELEKQTCEVCGIEAVDASRSIRRAFEGAVVMPPTSYEASSLRAKTCSRSGMRLGHSNVS